MGTMEPSDSILSALQRFREDCTIADFTLVSSSGREWPVHKLVLGMHSDVLYRMSTSKDFVECQNGRAVLNEIDDRCIEAMVDYFYDVHCDYPDEDGTSLDVGTLSKEAVNDYVTFKLEMWQSADMYNVVGMKKRIVADIDGSLGCTAEMGLVIRMADALCQANGVPKEMWEPVIVKSARWFKSTDGFTVDDRNELLGVLRQQPEIAIDMLQKISEQTGQGWGAAGR